MEKKSNCAKFPFSRNAELVSASLLIFLTMEENSFSIGVSGSCFIQHKKQRACVVYARCFSACRLLFKETRLAVRGG